MKKIHNLVVDARFAVCQKVLVALATRFRGLNFSNEKVSDPLNNDYVVKFYTVRDVDQQYYGAVRDYAEGFYDAIRVRDIEKPAPVAEQTFNDLSVGDVFSFTTAMGFVGKTKYLKLTQQRALNLYTNEIQKILSGPVIKDENLTMNRAKWVQSLSMMPKTKFGDLEIGAVFCFSSNPKTQYLKVAPEKQNSQSYQCIQINTNELCMCHDDASVIVNTLATDENDAAMIELQE